MFGSCVTGAACSTAHAADATGDKLAAVVPFPNSPLVLSPQAHMLPSVFSITLNALPAVTSLAPLMPGTTPGVFRAVVFPVPSCPDALYPQAHTDPSFLTARL